MWIKTILPKSLFGRALLILVLPTMLLQLVMAYVFFDRHWDNVSRHMAGALAGETVFLIRQLAAAPPRSKTRVVVDFERATGISVFFEGPQHFPARPDITVFPEFQERLRQNLTEPFAVAKSSTGDHVVVFIRLPDHTLRLETTAKRLESRTTVIFILWMIGASAVFVLIAVLFMRNQIRPIDRLAKAAENFGRGVDTPGFRPHGASEVRKAARAFIVMRERITRQIKTRTDMLAGISHDLRTPLTRMKLQLVMMAADDNRRELEDDVKQMEHMIAEYLDFARSEGGEETVRINLRGLLEDVVSDYRRMQAQVLLSAPQDVSADLRVSAFRRMLHNILDNALRYGKRCEVTLKPAVNYFEIIVDDDGPGIPRDKREEVFRPFARLEHSRNVKTGGVGLGLSIARDVAKSHGGGISLETAPAGGLRVVIRLPL